jgi:hypothetical protein
VITKEKVEMPTGKKPAHDAGKLLGGKNTPKNVKDVAASDLAQTPPKKTPPPKKK